MHSSRNITQNFLPHSYYVHVSIKTRSDFLIIYTHSAYKTALNPNLFFDVVQFVRRFTEKAMILDRSPIIIFTSINNRQCKS
jgi:hypothetical protein